MSSPVSENTRTRFLSPVHSFSFSASENSVYRPIASTVYRRRFRFSEEWMSQSLRRESFKRCSFFVACDEIGLRG
jgi:hypothetical protein